MCKATIVKMRYQLCAITVLVLGSVVLSQPASAAKPLPQSVTASECTQAGGSVLQQHILETCAGGKFNGIPVVDIVRKGSGGEGKQPRPAGRPPGSPEPEEEPVQQRR